MAERTTTERLVRLVESGKAQSQACAGRALGVSRERVRQIVKAEGLTLGHHTKQPNTLISWPCPACGKSVEMWTVWRQQRRSAYCTSCARHLNARRSFGARRQKLQCSAPGCHRQRRARGWCPTHYKRWKKGQDMAPPIRTHFGTERCKAQGCQERHNAKGLCLAHYAQAQTLAAWEARRA